MAKTSPKYREYLVGQTGACAEPFVYDRLSLEKFLDLDRVAYAVTKSKKFGGKFPAHVLEDEPMKAKHPINRYKTAGGLVVMNHEGTLDRYTNLFGRFGVKSSEVRRIYLSAGLAPFVLRTYLERCDDQQVSVFLDTALCASRLLLGRLQSDQQNKALPTSMREIATVLEQKLETTKATDIARINKTRLGIGMFAFHNTIADQGEGAFRHSGAFFDSLQAYGLEETMLDFGLIQKNAIGRFKSLRHTPWTQEAILATSLLYPMDVPEISDTLAVATVGGTQRIK